MDEQRAEKYKEVRLEYLDFFEPVTHLLLWQGFFVICGQIFAKDFGGHRSKHIHALIAQVRLTDPTLAGALESKIGKNSSLEMFRTLRNKISAHREAGLSPSRLLAILKPRKADLDALLQFTKVIVADVAEALGVEKASAVRQRISVCGDSSYQSTFRVLEDLDRELKRDEGSGAD